MPRVGVIAGCGTSGFTGDRGRSGDVRILLGFLELTGGGVRGLDLRLELGGHADQLREVLQSRFVLQIVASLQLGVVAGLGQDRLEQLGRAFPAACLLLQVIEHRDESAYRIQRAGGDPGRLLGAAQGLPEADPFPLGEHRDRGLGPIPDAALGNVQDAAQVDLVGRVGQHLQVGDRVLDLAPLVEAGPTDHPIRQADADQLVLQRARLRIGAVEDGDVAGVAPVVDQGVDLAADVAGLGLLVVGHVQGDLVTGALIGPQVLLASALVTLDQ